MTSAKQQLVEGSPFSGMSLPKRVSYVFIIVMMVLVAMIHLATPVLTILFSYFALTKLQFAKSKAIAISLFTLLVTVIFVGFAFFLRQALISLPEIADQTLPKVIKFAQSHDVELPFKDLEFVQGPDGEYVPGQGWERLKTTVLDNARTQFRSLGAFAKFTTVQFAMFIVGLVVAVSMFRSGRLDLDREERPNQQDNFYFQCIDEISARFRCFYASFATVMGAQLVISAINTALTSIFITWTWMPYAGLIIPVTFLCGLLPIIGNIISNTVIVGIALTISEKFAISALLFLVCLHKLEYFLNSKIIGRRIKNPMWLTLLALIIGERLMGIPGMILAPIVLHYIKVEMSTIRAERASKTAIELPQAA